MAVLAAVAHRNILSSLFAPIDSGATLEFFSRHGQLTMVKSYLCVIILNILCASKYLWLTIISFRKFEHSKTFGLVTSASSNAIWVRDYASAGVARQTGAGRAVAGAGEEVLCWDIKKGELLGRWKDSSCKAQVTVVTQSKTDEDIFAVG